MGMENLAKMRRNEADLLRGAWNRIHVSEDADEIEAHLMSALRYIDRIEAFAAQETAGTEADPETETELYTTFDACLLILARSHDSSLIRANASLARTMVRRHAAIARVDALALEAIRKPAQEAAGRVARAFEDVEENDKGFKETTHAAYWPSGCLQLIEDGAIVAKYMAPPW